MNKPVYFLDTETTHQDSSIARVVEIAIISPHEQICEKIRPPVPISIGAMATHHITEEMIRDEDIFENSYSHKWLLIDGKEYILVAHNAPYDVAVLANEGIIISEYIDTLRVAKHLLDDPKIESFSLQYLRYFYKLDDLHMGELTDGFAHSALYDTVVLKWFYEFLEEKLTDMEIHDTVEHMIRLTNTPVPIKTFRFGKYKDQKIADIARTDRGYIEWLYKSETMKPENEQNEDLVYTLKSIIYP